jgi:uncharacterized protein YbjT (DUF2867 family)
MNPMTTTKARILVAGASGNLGSKIVRELVALDAATVRVTHRERSKPEAVARLRATGAELVTADLSDEASLARACDGIDVVVSAVQGLREAVVDGQTRLLRAAEKAGVGRMIPSDYSVDFFKTIPGQNRNLDLRREFNGVLDASSVRGTSVLGGAFMDLLAFGMIGPDAKTGIYKVWGDENQPYDFTSTDDLAKYIAAAALDPSAGRVVRVAGDSLSPRELGAIFAEVRGTPVTIEHAGSLGDLDRIVDRLRAADEAPNNPFPVWQQLQYARDMASGRGKLSPLDNDRYPSIRPTPVRAYLRPRAA